MTAGPSAPGEYRTLIGPDASGAWGWAGLRLDARRGLAATHAYLELPAAERESRIAGAEAAWLASQWTDADQARFEVRYRTVPDLQRLECAALVRVRGADGAGAAQAADRRLGVLAQLPPHVAAEPLGSAAEVRGWLVPFDPHPRGVFEIRKRAVWAPIARPDSARTAGVAFDEFGAPGGGRASWEPLLRALAALPFRALLGVCFVPFPAGPGFQAHLAHLAAEYAALAVPVTSSPVFSRALPADPFAVDAAPRYARARQLYSGLCHRVRISLAAEQELPQYLGELAAAAVSPGGGAVALRPAAEELATVRGNLGALNTDALAATFLQGAPPAAFGPAEQVLADLVDVGQGAAALRLPVEWPGHEELFAAAQRPAAPADPWEDPDSGGDPLLVRNPFDPA
jgi:hypothetical protein